MINARRSSPPHSFIRRMMMMIERGFQQFFFLLSALSILFLPSTFFSFFCLCVPWHTMSVPIATGNGNIQWGLTTFCVSPNTFAPSVLTRWSLYSMPIDIGFILSLSLYSILTYKYIEIDLLRQKRVLGRVFCCYCLLYFFYQMRIWQRKKKYCGIVLAKDTHTH